MAHHETTIATQCPSCSAGATIVYVASTGSKLGFHGNLKCTKCALAYQIDYTALPADVQKAFLREEGQWQLWIRERGPTPLDVLKKLRQMMNVSVEQAVAISKGRAPVLSGMLAEIEQAAFELSEVGAVVAPMRN